MGESTSQIEWDIASERNALGRNLHELETKAKSLTDWRTYYRNHPLAMIGLALGGGVVLGVVTSARRGRDWKASRELDSTYPDTSYPDTTYPKTPRLTSATTARVRRQFGDTWDHIADALLGVASAKAIEYVSEMIPGFRDEYSSRYPEHRVPFSSGARSV